MNTQTIMPWLERAGRFEVEHIGGIPHINEAAYLTSARCGVLHTTEGEWAGSLAVFQKHWAPHFLLGMDSGQKRVRIAQLVQIGTIGAALVTHNNLAIVQVEMIGYSKQQLWQPDDETLDALAALMEECRREYDIPLTHPWPDGDYGVYGPNPHRLSGKFGKVAGWYAHGDVPAPDVHWDVGNFKWSAVFERAAKLADPRIAKWSPPAETEQRPCERARRDDDVVSPAKTFLKTQFQFPSLQIASGAELDAIGGRLGLNRCLSDSEFRKLIEAHS